MTEKERMMRQDMIPRHLKEIEEEFEVKVLLAVESGSRAWGFASPDSDWDVRFVYVHKPEWYMQIEDGRDVIERMYDDDVDLAGWDLRKALFLFKRSNPSLLEWIHSPIVYCQDDAFVSELHALEPEYYDLVRAMQKYRGMYVSHNERYLQNEGYTLKRFLYYLRGVLACRWIEMYRSAPPVQFTELVQGTVMEKTILEGVNEVLRLKSESRENYKKTVDDCLVAYAEHLAAYYSRFDLAALKDEENLHDSRLLNELMFKVVMQHSI